jgi:hypothetical protein
MINELILAAGEINSSDVINTPIFGPVKSVFRVIAIIVVLIGTWKVIQTLMAKDESGKPIRIALMYLAASFLLWDITIMASIVDVFQPLVAKISTSITQVFTKVSN